MSVSGGPSSSAASGYGKSIAAVLAGAIGTLIVWITDTVMQHYGQQSLPPEIVDAVQTICTTVAVLFTPHNLGSS